MGRTRQMNKVRPQLASSQGDGSGLHLIFTFLQELHQIEKISLVFNQVGNTVRWPGFSEIVRVKTCRGFRSTWMPERLGSGHLAVGPDGGTP